MLDSVGGRIEHIIKISGLSQSEIAEQCGVSKQAITGWIRKSSISKQNLLKLCSITDTRWEWVLTQQGEMMNRSQDEHDQGVPNASASYSTESIEILQKIEQLSEADKARLSAILDAFNRELDPTAE